MQMLTEKEEKEKKKNVMTEGQSMEETMVEPDPEP